jgi:shikimate kinase
MSNSIYLVGFMGSGKSTVGRRLAEALGWTFVDLDDDIEAATGRTIADIFSNDGEQAFRDAEHAALQARVSGSNAVVALGGGAFTFVRNRDVMKGAGTSVWLDCPFELALRRVEGFAQGSGNGD